MQLYALLSNSPRAAEILNDFNKVIADAHADTAHCVSNNESSKHNKTRQFLMSIANRIFTERPLSQVDVVAHLPGYPTEFPNDDGWMFLHASALY
jgi:hypothetical protein